MEAQQQYRLETDPPYPDRPATLAMVWAANPLSQAVTTATLYPSGSRALEPGSAVRNCVAGPQ